MQPCPGQPYAKARVNPGHGSPGDGKGKEKQKGARLGAQRFHTCASSAGGSPWPLCQTLSKNCSSSTRLGRWRGWNKRPDSTADMNRDRA